MEKKVFLVSLFLLLALTTLIPAGVSYDDYAMKWQLCSAMNFSGSTCDVWWSAFADTPSQNITGEAFITENYYDKTQIDELLTRIATANYTIGIDNTGNTSGFLTKAYFDDWTVTYRNSMLNNTATKQEVQNLRSLYYSDSKSGVSDSVVLIIGGVIVLGLVVGGVYMNKKNKKPKLNPIGEIEPIVQTIKSKKDLEKEGKAKEPKEEPKK